MLVLVRTLALAWVVVTLAMWFVVLVHTALPWVAPPPIDPGLWSTLAAVGAAVWLWKSGK